MSLSVFISHSVGPSEIPIVNQVSASLIGAGVQPYLAYYHRDLGSQLVPQVQQAIEASDALLVVWTKSGAESAWVNQEVGYAIGQGKTIYALVERGVAVKGMLHGQRYLEFDPSQPNAELDYMAQYLAYVRSQKELAIAQRQAAAAEEQAAQAAALAGVLFIGLIIAVLAMSRK